MLLNAVAVSMKVLCFCAGGAALRNGIALLDLRYSLRWGVGEVGNIVRGYW